MKIQALSESYRKMEDSLTIRDGWNWLLTNNLTLIYFQDSFYNVTLSL